MTSTRPCPGTDIIVARMGKLLQPRSVALVGASQREHSAGLRILRNIITGRFTGALYPVNPRYESVQQLRCYPSLASLPERVDAVFIAIPAEDAVSVLDEAGSLGIPAALINATGFADAGPDGAARQQRLVAVARRHGMAVCGPNNSGYINLWDRCFLSTYYTMPRPEPGPVALITQSGSVGIALSQDDRRLGLGYIITVGNEAVLGLADYLRFVVRDERIKVVMMFIETIRDAPAFAAAAREAAERGKPVIVTKIGKSETSRTAIAAHSGALAGEDALCDAFLRRHGVIRAADLDEMIETAVLFSAYPGPPRSSHVVPVTLSGGEAGLIADIGAERGLSIPPLAAETAARLQPLLSPYFLPGNPLDAMGLGWDGARFAQVLSILFEDAAIGTVAIAADTSASGLGEAVLMGEAAKQCAALAMPPGKRLLFFTNTAAGGVNPDIEATLEAAGIPILCGLRASLGALRNWSRRPDLPPAARSTQDRTLPASFATMAEDERFATLAAAGLPMAPTLGAASAVDAVAAAERLGYPVVLKGTAPNLPHKSELGVVRLGLHDAVAVREAYCAMAATLQQHAPGDDAAIVVQPMISDGIELIVAIRNDPTFGPAIVAGLGGTLVEILSEASVRLAPVDDGEAWEMLRETKAAKLLAGVRGRGPFDLDAAVGAIVALSQLAAGCAELAALEINPLIVRERGKGAVGVDLLVEPLASAKFQSGQP
jgi:acyl-CoA synthetase (NDP forming)